MTDTVESLDVNVDILRAMLWQFDQSPALSSLLGAKQQRYFELNDEFWAAWVRDVFDLRTANDFGCAVWAIILGVPLALIVPPTPTTVVPFGFGDFNKNFGNGNFARSGDGVLSLTLEQKRLILRMRYFQLTSRGTVPEQNAFLDALFPDGGAYVLDPGDMSFVYFVFTERPSSQILEVLRFFDLLPRPAAVGVKYVYDPRGAFGFGEYNENFGNGTFAPSN